jgi:hypothetical protein
MADRSISQLGTATALTGDELTVVVQNGITKQTQLQDIANLGGPTGPQGPIGPVGPIGPGATIQVNTTTTGAPGTNAIVTNVGSLTSALFDFVIPRGDPGPNTYFAGTGLSLTGTTFDIANTGVTAATYGSATQVPVFAVNAQGQITSVTNTAITAGGLGAITAVNGTANEITTSQVGTVVTASLPNALTFTGKTITGGTLASVAIDGSTNTLSNIANGSLTNSSVTIGSSSLSLGGTLSTLASVSISGSTNTLSNIANSSLTNSSVTIGSSSLSLGGTLTTLAGTSISGSSNTLTNIPNSALTNNSITLGTTNIALGGTSLTPAGLTSVTVTQDPVAALDLATKQYVDAVAQGLDPKASCVAATTADITLSGAQTIDGVALVAGDRCLVKNQTTTADNGIYVVAAGSWTRALDMNVWAEVPGAFTFIEQGTTLADTGWVCTSNAVGTIGVTAITFVQFAGVGSYTAGTGLTLTGTQFSITSTAVTAGSYTNANITVNAQGQITLASNGAAGGVTSFSAGTTGFSPNTASTGAIVLTGTLNVANGGTGGTATPTAGTVAYGTGTAYAFTAAGTAGQVLISNGVSAPSWTTLSSGASLSNDTTTATNLYPIFADATTGTPTTVYTSNAKYLYKPSTGELQASALVASNGLIVNNTTVSTSYTVATGTNAMSVGPVTLASGATVTVASGQRWLVL